MERLRADVPNVPPFKCPRCNHVAKDLKSLIRHYGLNHKVVLAILNERAGNPNCDSEAILKQYETSESNREICPLCKSTFGGRYMLLRHLAGKHENRPKSDLFVTIVYL